MSGREALFPDVNQGCRLGVSRAITWFFEQVEEGIVLEDDYSYLIPTSFHIVQNYWSGTAMTCEFGVVVAVIFRTVNGVATAVITLAGTIIVGAGRVGDDVSMGTDLFSIDITIELGLFKTVVLNIQRGSFTGREYGKDF